MRYFDTFKLFISGYLLTKYPLKLSIDSLLSIYQLVYSIFLYYVVYNDKKQQCFQLKYMWSLRSNRYTLLGTLGGNIILCILGQCGSFVLEYTHIYKKIEVSYIFNQRDKFLPVTLKESKMVLVNTRIEHRYCIYPKSIGI